ncbi:hypothetical protein M422DRAFT_271247 [Sphaerobolus stellatus SS14]|uniref:POLO box domain-containing protein n=1 Tax=Sphaerobolus stellatus (strain SS14) TaxID=990650 RepID=A0A0C9TE84_SPHS4|nr:hypothetical protein M422DRAFT_271247 [Sphaerobolus stellatus SS14]
MSSDGLQLPKVFIVSWVDYCNKYGMGYALTDGSVGVHFNDGTSMVLAPDKKHLDYVVPQTHEPSVRKNYTMTEYPENLKTKIYLMKHFEKYMMERLYGDYEYTYQDLERTKDLDFVKRYHRDKHVTSFQMSHGVFQFNFHDHTKVILSSQGMLVTHIDKNYVRTRWPLVDIIRQALLPPHHDPAKAKMYSRLFERLKYCQSSLVNLRNVQSGSNNVNAASTTTKANPSSVEAPLR